MADQITQEIKDRLNIADVIAGYIPIKKAGANFKALCPFHGEKTASLQISPQKQIWHCFGCGEGGDVFGFVIKYENLDFKDALKILADKAGVTLPAYGSATGAKISSDEKDLFLRINNFAARYYHQILVKDGRGKAALEYLKHRGLNEATIAKWQIGFAPDDYHALEKALAQKKVAPADLVKAGVSAKNERGQMYDRFRGRVTFPVYNYFGEVVGFSARILNDDGKSAKYVNSPETVIYNKSKILFGLNFAKDGIRKGDEAVMVEGQMDCVSAHQAGFNNVVASSGTALTEQQLQQLGRLTKNLKFCFDSDAAGQAAARRAGETALKMGFRLKLIVLAASSEDKLDPDDIIKKSPGLWQKAVSEAVWFLDYYINSAELNFPAGSVEQKLYLGEQVVPFLVFVSDPLEQDHYIHKIATKFLISEATLRRQIKPQNTAAASVISRANNGNLLLEKEVLGGLLVFEDFRREVLGKLEPEDFETMEIGQMVTRLGSGNPDGDMFSQSAIAKEAQFMVESQLDELGGNQIPLLRELFKAFALLRTVSIKKQQQNLQSEIKMAEIAQNKEKIHELNQKFAIISAEKMQLEALL